MKTKIYISLILALICFNSCERTNCHNKVKDGDETGVDCGGSCLDCPPTVTTFPVSQITTTSANVSMKYYGIINENFYMAGICYSTTQNPTYSSGKISTSIFDSDGYWIEQLKTLTPNTTYYIKGFAIDDKAIVYGNEVSFTTASMVPILPTIVTTTATAITPTTGVSGGNITSDGGAPVTVRGICFSTTTNPTTANTVISGGSGIGSFSSNLSGLTALTTYYIRAFATNSVGTAYGNQVSFTTTEYVIPTLTTIIASSITKTTATSGGDITSDGGATVTSRGICFNTAGNPTTANTIVSGGSGIGSFSCNLVGLSAAKTYYIRAYAINSVGTAYGNQISFSTSSPFTIGQSYGGGIIAYIDSTGFHGLIAAPTDQSTDIYWHVTADGTTGAMGTAIGTGNANTNSIIALYGAENNAARICYDLVLGGYSDWYLPSKDELYQLNINKVKIGGFANASYWSSTESSSDRATYRDYQFAGGWGLALKRAKCYVRAVRSF